MSHAVYCGEHISADSNTYLEKIQKLHIPEIFTATVMHWSKTPEQIPDSFRCLCLILKIITNRSEVELGKLKGKPRQ